MHPFPNGGLPRVFGASGPEVIGLLSVVASRVCDAIPPSPHLVESMGVFHGPPKFFRLQENKSRFSDAKFPALGRVIRLVAEIFLSRLYGAFGFVNECLQYV